MKPWCGPCSALQEAATKRGKCHCTGRMHHNIIIIIINANIIITNNNINIIIITSAASYLSSPSCLSIVCTTMSKFFENWFLVQKLWHMLLFFLNVKNAWKPQQTYEEQWKATLSARKSVMQHFVLFRVQSANKFFQTSVISKLGDPCPLSTLSSPILIIQ